jgi:hypothetical protein
MTYGIYLGKMLKKLRVCRSKWVVKGCGRKG